MQANNFLKQYAVQKTDFTETSQSEANLVEAQHNDAIALDLLVSGGIIGGIIAGAVVVLMLPKIQTIMQERILYKLKGLNKLPCHNCKFYSGNLYLRCAVNPAIVMTKEAKNCGEYNPSSDQISNQQ
jgi:hypothetical protein